MIFAFNTTSNMLMFYSLLVINGSSFVLLCYGILCPLMRSVFFFIGSTQSLPCTTASGDNCTSSICPNTVVTYTCTITNGTPAGYTDWTLPSGACPSNTFADTIRLSQFTTHQCALYGGSNMCGPYKASSILPSSGLYCLSSILTVSITAAMNGVTVRCSNTNIGTSAQTVVSMATINVVGMSFICIDIHVHVVCIHNFLHCHHTYTLHVMYIVIVSGLHYEQPLSSEWA